jgi:hypothetical protein
VASFPIHFPNVTTNATPIHYHNSAQPALPDGALSVIDEVSVRDGHLHVHGWALAQAPLTAIRLSIDGNAIGDAQLGLPRPDVQAQHPMFDNVNSGFAFHRPLAPPLLSGSHNLALTLVSSDGPIWHVHKQYDFS